MLVVKTKVKTSKIHGLGLFADQNIRKGQVVWEYNSLIDRKISKRKLVKLPILVQNFIKFYSYLNENEEYVLCGDGARYINHSDNPNVLDVKTFFDKIFCSEGFAIAARDIKKGEEIISRYLYFDKRGRAKHLV